eukprot:TRINITY_DN47916_c0_g1_i1.p1 TRINITY_DN47916_c0_g1~~TRINITY_DN47916_c0_g1_i1.p1  ORF type:complete len:509 (+),score=160.54 TRINITY_DN47916_c0_g1_i1:54-1529(+)
MSLVGLSREPSLEASLASYASDDLLVGSFSGDMMVEECRKRSWSCPPTDSDMLEEGEGATLPSLVSDRESEASLEDPLHPPRRGLNASAVAFVPAPRIPDTMYPLLAPMHPHVPSQPEVTIPYQAIQGRSVETCSTPEGCKVLQASLPHWPIAHQEAFYHEVHHTIPTLMKDMSGSYVVQRLVESPSPVVKAGLVRCVKKELVELSLQPFSCRMVQKILDTLGERECIEMAAELDGHVLGCVQDQHGNHVVQRFIDLIPAHCDFVMRAFFGKVLEVATHSYGCRVVQRVLEKCRETNEIMKILEEILQHVQALSMDQYGNYVVQHVVKHGHPQYQYALSSKLAPVFGTVTSHKFASNVIEKMIEHVPSSRQDLIHELSKPCIADRSVSALAACAMDPFGNYVIQKLFDYCSEAQKKMIHVHLQPFMHLLSRSHHAKNLQQKLKYMSNAMSGAGGGMRRPVAQPHPQSAQSAYLMPMMYPTLPHIPPVQRPY